MWYLHSTYAEFLNIVSSYIDISLGFAEVNQSRSAYMPVSPAPSSPTLPFVSRPDITGLVDWAFDSSIANILCLSVFVPVSLCPCTYVSLMFSFFVCVRVNKKLDPMCPVDVIFTLFRSALVKVALVAIYIRTFILNT